MLQEQDKEALEKLIAAGDFTQAHSLGKKLGTKENVEELNVFWVSLCKKYEVGIFSSNPVLPKTEGAVAPLSTQEDIL